MQRATCTTLAIAVFLFQLGLPLLHFHPAVEHQGGHGTFHHHEAVIHTHLPGFARHSHSGSSSLEPDELEAFPLDIPALVSAPVCSWAPWGVAQLDSFRIVDPDVQGSVLQLVPEAQPPPPFRTLSSPRAPPA